MERVSISHLPASIRKRPEIQALTLTVYADPLDDRHFQVPGTSKIYDLYVVDSTIGCDCPATLPCKHAMAVQLQHPHLKLQQKDS